MSANHEGFSLLFPFLPVESVGGPFSDDGYVAGFEAGQIAAMMEDGGAINPRYVNAANVAQIDLMAMHYGYTIEAEPWEEHPDEWALVTFHRVPVEVLP